MNRGSPETLLKNQSITLLYRDIAQAFDSPADHFPCNPESNRALVGMQFGAGRVYAQDARDGKQEAGETEGILGQTHLPIAATAWNRDLTYSCTFRVSPTNRCR